MSTQLIIQRIQDAQREVQELSNLVARGPAGRELALCFTKLQEAEDWANRASTFLSSGELANKEG